MKPLLGIRQSLVLLSIQVTCNLLGIPAQDSASFHRTALSGRDDSLFLVSATTWLILNFQSLQYPRQMRIIFQPGAGFISSLQGNPGDRQTGKTIETIFS